MRLLLRCQNFGDESRPVRLVRVILIAYMLLTDARPTTLLRDHFISPPLPKRSVLSTLSNNPSGPEQLTKTPRGARL